eukprot:gene21322-23396_t
MTEKGNYTLAIVKTKECYDNLEECLADLIAAMKQLSQITINGNTYQIKYFLGEDWKFLAIICGIGTANKDFAGIWCHFPRQARWDHEKEWSITDRAKGAPILSSTKANAKVKKFSCKFEQSLLKQGTSGTSAENAE